MTNDSTTSAHDLLFWWRVTRYDPNRRDARGAYPADAWTSIADVGQQFSGDELTIDEYERVEDAYLDSFSAFAEESGVAHLVVRNLESGDGVREGQAVSIDTGRDIVRRLLREELICWLEASDQSFAVQVGFDLYMYVGSAAPCPNAQRRAEALSLFAEPGVASPLWPSPLKDGDF